MFHTCIRNLSTIFMSYSGHNPFPLPLPSAPSAWTWLDDKLFENALAAFPEGTPHRWGLIAAEVPGRTPEEVFEHYKVLLYDVEAIVSGRVELPIYANEERRDEEPSYGIHKGTADRGKERRKGVPWTEHEHKCFLDGLARYGKGDWKNISRWAVRTKTATQVASHAQKFFLRQTSSTKESKRKSIHDITDPRVGNT